MAASRRTSNIWLINYQIARFLNLISERMLFTLMFHKAAEVRGEGGAHIFQLGSSNVVWLPVFIRRMLLLKAILPVSLTHWWSTHKRFKISIYMVHMVQLSDMLLGKFDRTLIADHNTVLMFSVLVLRRRRRLHVPGSGYFTPWTPSP